jgi:hypothetical protein
MSDIKPYRPGDVAPKTDGNPEGKGYIGFLKDWEDTEPRGVVAKPSRQVLAEFFTSMLVLSSQFKYQPVIGNSNYLYWINSEWSMSLIAPYEWSDERRAAFAGTCVLQQDMTWTIEPSEHLASENAVSAAVAEFYDAFADMLDTDLTLEDILPTYVAKLPYYQRLHAAALSRSLRGTLLLGDRTAISCRDWFPQLPQLARMLP